MNISISRLPLVCQAEFRQQAVRLHNLKSHPHRFPDLLDQFYDSKHMAHLRRAHKIGVIYWWHSPSDAAYSEALLNAGPAGYR